MAQLTRSTKIGGGTTLQSNTLARATDVEADILALFNAHNNHDTGTSKWTVVSTEGASSVPLISNNSTGTQNIFEARDNGTAVLTVADGGAVTLTAASSSIVPLTVTSANGGSAKTAIINNGTSTGNILEIQDNGTPRLTVADGGTVTLNGGTLAMGSQKITGLASGTASTDAAAFGQIKVLQTIKAVTDTTFQTTSSTFQSTNVTASITPTSASNRILILASGELECAGNTTVFYLTIDRGGTDLDPGNGLTSCQAGTGAGTFRFPVGVAFIDAPATTSATTYTVQIKNANNASAINFPASATNGTGRGAITLMEIV